MLTGPFQAQDSDKKLAAAQAGDANGQYNLGNIYRLGNGFLQGYAEAVSEKGCRKNIAMTKILISLGAQKSGTTWLSRYMREHPECVTLPLKELHYFDPIDLNFDWMAAPRLQRLAKEFKSRAETNPSFGRSLNFRKSMGLLAELSAVYESKNPTPEGYERLILEHAPKRAKIISEVTPENGLLTVDRLKELSELKSGPLFCYIMRDPVSRALSAARMFAGRSGTGSNYSEKVKINLATYIDGKNLNVSRSENYGQVLDGIQKAIPHERVYVGFFEEFLTQEKIDEFCDFLDVKRYPGDFEVRRLASVPTDIDHDQKVAVSKKLQHIYDIVEARLGRIPASWKQNRALGS